jgi:ABC-2 type transport system permease protein
MSGRDAVRLVARREITERVREKAFAVSTGINIVIIVAVVIIAAVVGGGEESYKVGWIDESDRVVAQAAADAGRSADVTISLSQVGSPSPSAATQLEDGTLDAVVDGGRIQSEEEPDDQLLTLLQGANREVQAAAALEQAGVSGEEAQRALQPPPLEVSTLETVDEDDEGKAGVAFFAILILYGQLLTYGYWVSAGVVEEKASRVVEVVLSTIRPSHLLAGKVIGIGLLGLANLLLTVGIGLGVAQAVGSLDVDADIISAAALALAWFVVGYAFYACAFACAGALVPRQEELQSSMTPLTLTILVAFFVAFAVLSDPDGTLAHVTAFIPMTAPITMPPRIVTGDAPAWEIAASLAVTIGASLALIPLAARIYSGGILRTGSALKLRDAWRNTASPPAS